MKLQDPVRYITADQKSMFVPQPDGSTLIIRLIAGVLASFVGRPR